MNMGLDTLINVGWNILTLIPNAFKLTRDWWNFRRPASKIFGRMLDEKNEVLIFLKDFIVKNNTLSDPKLISSEGPTTQLHPNIDKVWAEAEARGAADIFNVIGDLGKRKKLELSEMSTGYGIWNKDMIVLGAQAMKCMDFYEVMEKVAYSMDETNIYDKQTGKVIERENGYGYGIILKAKNSQLQGGVGLLLGGFGVLGTEAAIYYFTHNLPELGKIFKNKCFGIIVRAKVSAGRQSVKRLKKYDRVFE